MRWTGGDNELRVNSLNAGDDCIGGYYLFFAHSRKAIQECNQKLMKALGTPSWPPCNCRA